MNYRMPMPTALHRPLFQVAQLIAAWLLVACLASVRAAPPADLFDVLEYRVEGNSVLATGAIEEAVYPHLGEGKGLPAVELARAALEKAYHDAGYLTVFVDIPEQTVDGGIVRLRATEGKVERLRVKGAHHYALGRIKAGIPELNEGAVPYFPEVQRQIADLNRQPDRRVTPILRAGRTPGTVEAELKVEDELPLHGELELTNRHSASTTASRLSGSLRYDNLWQREHSLSLAFQLAPENPDDARILSGTYVLPGSGGRTWAVYGVVSRSDVAQSGDLRVLGDTNILGARLIQALPTRGRGYSHSLTLGVDYKDFGEDLLFGTDTAARPVSYLPFSLQYGLNLGQPGHLTQYSLGVNFALRGLADDTIECTPGVMKNEFDCKRAGAKPNYLYLTAGFKHTRMLSDSLELSTGLSAQYSQSPLISNEQMSAGGAQSVRGYLESAAFGDRGISGSLGLNWRLPGEWLARPGVNASMGVFVDGAQLWVVDPGAGQQAAFTLAGIGLGGRVTLADGFSASLDLAWPLKTLADNEAWEAQWHGRLAYTW